MAVDTILQKQYSNNIALVAQEKEGELAKSVTVKPDCTGEVAFQDQLAKSTAREKMARNEVVINDDPSYGRRAIYPRYFYNAPLVDSMDKIMMMKDPTNSIVQSNAASLVRPKETVIGLGLHATAKTGTNGTVDADLAGTSLIAAGATGLNMSKIRQAQKVLDQNHVDKNERFFVASAEQKEDLLAITEVTNSDYAQIKALVNGQPGTLCGFNFIWSEDLPVDAAAARKCAAYHKSGICLGIWINLLTSIDLLPTKHFSAQVYAGQSYGATRLEEEKVIQVLCVE